MVDYANAPKVVCPVTDEDGEAAHRIGLLIDINSRYATVEFSDGEIVKVGKTKIEYIEDEKSKAKKAKKNPRRVKTRKADEPKYKEHWSEDDNCPHCGIGLDNGLQTNYHLKEAGLPGTDKYEYMCLACGGEFGLEIEHQKMKIDASRYQYEDCIAYSGRRSKDNGDAVALLLRGKSLDEVYKIASEHLETSVSALARQYGHLNPGQQRMCLGNRLRRKLIY